MRVPCQSSQRWPTLLVCSCRWLWGCPVSPHRDGLPYLSVLAGDYEGALSVLTEMAYLTCLFLQVTMRVPCQSSQRWPTLSVCSCRWLWGCPVSPHRDGLPCLSVLAGDYEGALSVLTEMAYLAQERGSLLSNGKLTGAFCDVLARCEITRVLLLMLLQVRVKLVQSHLSPQ